MQSLLRGTTVPALEQTLVFSQRRQEALASNIANMDTPGYRARDLSLEDFQTALADAVQATRHPSPGHLASGDPMDGPKRSMEHLLYHDGSDVNLERQVTQMAKNQHMHNLAIALMRSQFGVLQTAISERV